MGKNSHRPRNKPDKEETSKQPCSHHRTKVFFFLAFTQLLTATFFSFDTNSQPSLANQAHLHSSHWAFNAVNTVRAQQMWVYSENQASLFIACQANLTHVGSLLESWRCKAYCLAVVSMLSQWQDVGWEKSAWNWLDLLDFSSLCDHSLSAWEKRCTWQICVKNSNPLFSSSFCLSLTRIWEKRVHGTHFSEN